MEEKPQKGLFKGLPDDRITIEHYIRHFQDARPCADPGTPARFLRTGFCQEWFLRTSLYGTKTTLMSNDVLLVMPGQTHEFVLSEQIDIYNCQFYLDELSAVYCDISKSFEFSKSADLRPGFHRPDSRQREFGHGDLSASPSGSEPLCAAQYAGHYPSVVFSGPLSGKSV
jgi:hypothetical protein